ncbi:proteinase inhibitor [Spinacia oleracea]|uniref:Proteinase inhibitor n=1 Tax=Spinacia oleracea TaxID=3562 RepID=A0A9R0I641_SPIOL|nr:proteinase inhibitor-like [Spinacia oleracea]
MEQEGECKCPPISCSGPVKGFGVGKNVWPELVGENGEVAVTTIKRENDKVLEATIIRPGMGMQQNLCSYRVFVQVNSDGVVFCPPHIG